MSRSFDLCPQCGDEQTEIEAWLFSQRLVVAKQADKWCEDRGLPITSLNVVTALINNGHPLYKQNMNQQ